MALASSLDFEKAAFAALRRPCVFPNVARKIRSAAVAFSVAASPLLAGCSTVGIESTGGYADDFTKKVGPAEEAALLQKKFLKDSAELRRALDRCDAGYPCVQAVQDMAVFRREVRQVHDVLTQALLVQAYVNLRAVYDWKEAASDGDDLSHHSLLEAVTAGAFICDESAQAKLFLFNEIGIRRGRARWVGEEVYSLKTGQIFGYHAIVDAAIGKTVFALENYDTWDGEPSRRYTWEQVVAASMIQSDAFQLNFTGKSDVADLVYVPTVSFSSVSVRYYKSSPPDGSFSNVPLVARRAVGPVLTLDNVTVDHTRVMKILKPAFIDHDISFKNMAISNAVPRTPMSLSPRRGTLISALSPSP